MITVTRLNRQEVALNCDLIELVEALPDTTIRLVTGKIFVVREPLIEVLAKIRDWRAGVARGAGLEGLVANSLSPLVLHPPCADEDDEDEDESAAVRLERFLEVPA